MAHGSVIRKALAFPGLSSTTASQTVNTIVGAAVPGVDAKQYAFSSNRSPSLAPATIVPQERRLDLPPQGNSEGPVTAIGIAPDSAIQSCFVALGGKQGVSSRHLISPGNPLVGSELDGADFAMISLPMMPPAIQIVELVSHVDVLWDANVMTLPSVGLIGGWPLRLEIWRGAPIPLRAHWRAPYFARGVFLLADSGSGEGSDDASFYVCVDGRSKIDVTVAVPDPTYTDSVTVTIASLEPVTSSAQRNVDTYVAVPLVLDNLGNTSQVVSSTTPAIFSFGDGTPMVLLRVNVAIVVGAGTKVSWAHVNVRAYDG